MKPHILTLLVALATSFSSASAITADELARYFGISAWSTTVTLPAKTFTAEIYSIKNGAPGERLIEGMPAWNKSHDKGISILLGSESGKYRIVVIYGGGVTMGLTSNISTFSSTSAPSLPETIQEGDYVLFGKPKDYKLPAENIAGYESGFLLRIKKG